jgi:hypothetical protein
MPAFPRSFAATAIHGPSGTVLRGPANPGDVLLAFQAADSGGHSALGLDGGWELLDSHLGSAWSGSQSGVWAGAKLWRRVCRTGEPASYTAYQGGVAAGIVIIAAVAAGEAGSIVSASDYGTSAPNLTPQAASGLELRLAAGVPELPGGGVSWSVPPGFTKQADAQSGLWTTAVAATRTFASNAPVGAASMSPSSGLPAVAFTVLVASTQAQTPDPPVVQPGAPGRGTSLYRYSFYNLLTRQYLGDLNLAGVAFDKRILQPGSFTATVPIPNRRVRAKVADVLPVDDSVLDRGPGVITVQVYRDGQPWGEYWITAATVARSRRGTPAISLRGSTLDAYLSRVEIQDDLSYVGEDQIDIARHLLNSMMLQPHANIGLVVAPGTSGVVRDRTYLDADGATYGQRLLELAQVEDGFESMVNLELAGGGLVRRYAWGYPLLGVQDPPQHRFADGRNGGSILEWSEEIDALRGATRWRARGSTASTDASTSSVPIVSAVHEATAHLAAGWPRLDRTLSYSTVTEQSTLEDYAAFWAARAGGALRVDQVTVALGRDPTLTPNHLGDAAAFYFNNAWHAGVWRTRRVIGIGITPTSRGSGKEEARLVLEGTEVPGA